MTDNEAPKLTDAQRERIIQLGGDPSTFYPTFDLPKGYVAGWAKGVYYGVDEDGRASS